MSITPKILRLIVHETGTITTYGETGEQLGFHLESGVTEIRFFIPSNLEGLHHHIYVKQPDGTIMVSQVLTEQTGDAYLSNKYVKIDVGDPITSQVGRVRLEYVGNDSSENRVFLSKAKNMDIDESVYGEYCASENGSWDSEWQKDIDDLETRVVAAEQSVAAANATAQTAETKSNEAKASAASAVSTAESAVSTAQGAVSTANAASSAASSAVSTANSASSTASAAANTAASAKSTAEGIDAKASSALAKSQEAKNDAATAISTANSAVSTANTASSTASSAVSTANSASSTASAAATAAAGAVATANAVKAEVEAFFTLKVGVSGPYTQIKDAEIGENMTVFTKGKSGANFVIEYFHGKNMLCPSDMTIGGDSRHSAAAYSRLIPEFAEYMYLTLPAGWKAYITEYNCLAYEGTGSVVSESSFTESGLVILTPSNIGKSFRVFLTKIIDNTEVIPTSSELAAIDSLTQLEYGEEATSHEAVSLPTVITPANCEIDTNNIIAIVAHSGFIGIVPASGTSASSLPVFATDENDLTKTYISYGTEGLVQQILANTVKNENQDAKLVDHEARIKALEQTSGNEVFGTQFTGLSTVGVRLLSSAGKTVDFDQGINDFQSVMPFLNIQDVEEFSYNPSTGDEILDPNGGHLVNHCMYFPDLYLQLVTMTNASAQTVQTLYVSTVARSGYTKVGHFLYGKYAGAWRAEDSSDWIGSFRGKQPVANYAWTTAASKMVGIKDPTLGLDSVTRLWSVPSGRAYTAISFLLVTLLGHRNIQSEWYGLTEDCNYNETTVRGWGNTGSSSEQLIVPSTDNAIAALSVGDKFTIFANGDRWLTKTILTKTVDSPSAGKTTITFSGAVNWSTGTIRVNVAGGHLTGVTDSIVGDFGSLNDIGTGACKIFGIEDFFGNLWTPLADVAVKQTFPNSASLNELLIDESPTIAMKTTYSGFTNTGVSLPTAEGWAATMGMADGFMTTIATSGSASSSAGWADYCYANRRTSAGTTYRQFLVGGSYGAAGKAGPFCFYSTIDWGDAGCGVGLRPFLPLP